MSVREHKQYFQFSTNTHHRLAHIVFWGNLAMIAISIPATMRFGLHGFMYTWLASETTQMALLYRENRKLFDHDPSISMIPVLKLAAFLGVSMPLCVFLLDYSRHHSLAVVASVPIVGTAALFLASYFVFGLNAAHRRALATFAGR